MYITSSRNKYSLAKKEPVFEEQPEPEENILSIKQANTLIFSDDDGAVHILDIKRFIVDFKIEPASDQTKRSNYFPTRPVKIDKNGLFASKEEVESELSQLKSIFIVTEELTKISQVYHHHWNSFDEAITMLSIVQIPKKLAITSSGTTVMKINSIFGEPLCVTNLDQPLPYSWKLIVDDSIKILK